LRVPKAVKQFVHRCGSLNDYVVIVYTCLKHLQSDTTFIIYPNVFPTVNTAINCSLRFPLCEHLTHLSKYKFTSWCNASSP